MQRKTISKYLFSVLFVLGSILISSKPVMAQKTGQDIHNIGAPSQLSFDGDGRGYRFAIVGNKPKPNATGTGIEPGVYQSMTVEGNMAWLREATSPNADAVTQDGVYFRSEVSDTAHGSRLHENTVFLDGNAPNQGYGAMTYMTPSAKQIVSTQEVLNVFKASSLTELLADASIDEANTRGFNILSNREACESLGTTPEAIISWYNSHAEKPYEGDPKDAWIICQTFANPRSWSTRGGGFNGQDLDIGLTWRALETCMVVDGNGVHYDENAGAGTFAAWVCKDRPRVQAGNLEKNIFVNTLGFWNETLTPYDDTLPQWKSTGKAKIRGSWYAIGAVDFFNVYSGVGIYAFSDGSSSQKIQGNTLVEYTAEPGSTAVGQFITYGQVFKDADAPSDKDGTGSSGQSNISIENKNFYIWTGQKWEAPTSLANKFACEDLDPRINLYTLYRDTKGNGGETFYCTPRAGMDMNTMKNTVFKPTLNLAVNWGNVLPQNVYKTKLGSAYGIRGIGGRTDLSAIADVINANAGGGSHAAGDQTKKQEGIYENANQTVVDSISRSQAKNYNVMTKTTTGKNVGYGIELIYKAKPIKSTLYTIRVKDKALAGIDTEVQEYTSADYGYFFVEGDALVAVPNSLAVDVNAVAAACSSATPDNAASLLFGAVPNVPAAPDGCRIISPNETIATGSTSKLTGLLEGYTLYLLTTNDDKKHPKGDLTLPDYMTNSVWDNVIDWTYKKKNHTSAEYKILCNKDQWCYIYDQEHRGSFTGIRVYSAPDPKFCPACGMSNISQACNCHLNGHDSPSYYFPNGTGVVPDSEKTWKVSYKDFTTGTEASADNAYNTEYFMKATKSWDKVRRNSPNLLGSWVVVVDTKNINPELYRWDYAFNLCRRFNGDKRTISGIHPCAHENYGTNILDFDIGVKPSHIERTYAVTGVTTNTTRDSKAEVKVDKETISWKSHWDLWKSENGAQIHERQITGNYTYYIDTPLYTTDPVTHQQVPNGTRRDYYPTSHTRPEHYVEKDKTVLGFTQQGSPKTTVTYELEKHVQKYATEAMATASNSTKKLTNGAHKAGDPYVDDDLVNSFKLGMVKAHDSITLSYYPEIIMCGIIPNTTGSSNVEYAGGFNTVPYWIMGEKVRKLHPSSIYFYRMRPVGSHNVEGFTYSDTMMGSTSYSGENNIVNIPAGSDIKMVAQPKNIKLDLYCYALDLIDPSHDATVNEVFPYNEVVYSNDDVKSIWGNSDSYQKLFDEFKTWASSMTNPNNYQADVVLHLDNTSGTKVYTNFSTTLGNIKKGTYEEGKSWNIKVQHGSIIKGDSPDNGYDRLMKAISKDLYGDESHISEAEALFDESGIWQTIKKAMETDVDPANRSQQVTGDYTGDTLQVDDCASYLGGHSHWYDESTRTFVIRRFAQKDNMFQDIIAEDKIDYNSGAAAAGSNVHSYGQNRGAGSHGTWYVSIFVKKGVEFMCTDPNKSYDPSNISVPITDDKITNEMKAAKDEYRVILDRSPVFGADFKVPSSNTSNFGD